MMEANTETAPPVSGPPPKRRLRNYLLDPRFQLKYTGMVVLVTVIVASVLGYFAWDTSKGLTESMTATAMMYPDASVQTIVDQAAERDRNTLLAIVGGILILAASLGVTGILVTHKVVGPAYKMRLLHEQVASGKLKLGGRLRKGDELQELFESFAEMVQSLRDAQAREVAELDAAIQTAREAGCDADALSGIVDVRDRMHATLD